MFVFKKITSLLLTAAMLLLTGSPVFAVDSIATDESLDNTASVSLLSASEISILEEMLSGIPVFVTEMDITEQSQREQAQLIIGKELSAQLESRFIDCNTSVASDLVSASNVSSNPITISEDSYTVTELSSDNLANILEGPMFLNSLSYLADLAESGVTIEYINFYTKSNPYTVAQEASVLSTSSNADSEAH